MIQDSGGSARSHHAVSLSCDLAVGGGGLAGVCTAITAAREGLKVVLVQDRPVLGGNASSEVRLWILGATSHMGNNNRWAREGGVIDELMVENLYRNPEGNPILVDALLLEMVAAEPNITLLLNTAVHAVQKDEADPDRITAIEAFCSQNGTAYTVSAPLFCDATGDGVIGFLAGAAFRMGAEKPEEFGEGMAPDVEDYGELLGHSLYFFTRDTGKPVRYVAPSYALDDITKIPRYKQFRVQDHGCWLWWIEYGGRLDTIHQSEEIKWELWKVVYGLWDYFKNSGKFPEAENLTLEWVGMIPGKRESRRFEGDHMLVQQDLVEQRIHEDDVSYGGWAIDLHPADGVYSEKSGCTQYHAKGVYGIPLRSLYSRNIKNLFLGGRIISASHVAFGSTRVMATAGTNGGATGMAAALCHRHGCEPRQLLESGRIAELQRRLQQVGHYIPDVKLDDPADLVRSATITASSEATLDTLAPSGKWRQLDAPWAMMLPVEKGALPTVTYRLRASEPTTLRATLRISAKARNHTPDTDLATLEIPLASDGEQEVVLTFDATMPHEGYAFYTLEDNPAVEVALSDQRRTGVISVTHVLNKEVAKSAVQTPPEGSGIDTFAFWLPKRRPGGENLACTISPALEVYGTEQLTNGEGRPVTRPNAWAARLDDASPSLALSWDEPVTVSRIELGFDTDYDHPMESVVLGHEENVMPFCVADYRILDGSGEVIAAVTGNHHSHRRHELPAGTQLDSLRIELTHPTTTIPAALFSVRAYA